MRKLMTSLCVLVIVTSAARVVSALPTVEEILKNTDKAHQEVKSFSADTKVAMSMGPMKMSGTGEMSGMKGTKDGKPVDKFYQLMKTQSTTPDGQQIQMQMKVVSDGEYIWQEMRNPMMPVPMVTKQRAGSHARTGTPGGDPAQQMQQFMEMYDLEVTGEERLGGVAVYVLEGTLRDDYVEKHPEAQMMKTMMHKLRLYIGQDDFFPRKFVGLSAQGGETTSMELGNVRLNAVVDEKLFEYVPPAGAQVNDQTQEEVEEE